MEQIGYTLVKNEKANIILRFSNSPLIMYEFSPSQALILSNELRNLNK